MGIASIAGWHHAVKHIDAMSNPVDDILRRPYSHEIAGFGCRHLFDAGLDHRHHLLLWLTHGQASEGIAIEVHSHQFCQRLGSQMPVHAALHDAKQCRRMRTMGLLATPGPAHGQGHGVLRLFLRSGIGGALVEDHDDVGSQLMLHLNRRFWSEKYFGAVDG